MALYSLLMGQMKRPPIRPVESIVALMFFYPSRPQCRAHLAVEHIDRKVVERIADLSGEELRTQHESTPVSNAKAQSYSWVMAKKGVTCFMTLARKPSKISTITTDLASINMLS